MVVRLSKVTTSGFFGEKHKLSMSLAQLSGDLVDVQSFNNGKKSTSRMNMDALVKIPVKNILYITQLYEISSYSTVQKPRVTPRFFVF